MRKITYGAGLMIAMLFSIGFFSCQPEVQPYAQRTDSIGGQLSYVTGCKSGIGADTFYVSYLYDAQNRWAGSRIFIYADGDSVKQKLIITRDASGYITKYSLYDSSDYSNIDLFEKEILHDATGKYTKSYGLYPSVQDTILFAYDNQNKIVRTIEQDFSLLDTTGYHYTGTNLDSLSNDARIYSFAAASFVYDNRVAPSNLGNEAFIIDLPYLYGSANITRYTTFDRGIINGQGIITYTFNAANKPAMANLTMLPMNKQYIFTYHYR